MFKEFKEFVNQGNALDLAVGVLIGAAFGKIVNSLVADIINPIVGLALGGTDFKNLYIPLSGQPAGLPLDEVRKLPGAILAYGAFEQDPVHFLFNMLLFMPLGVLLYHEARRRSDGAAATKRVTTQCRPRKALSVHRAGSTCSRGGTGPRPSPTRRRRPRPPRNAPSGRRSSPHCATSRVASATA